MRECLQDVYDLPALLQLMRDIEARRIRVVEVETTTPSAFARSLLFGYVAEFIYEGDSPLAERKAAALALDPALLGELLGRTELRDLLDPDVIDETERDLQWLSETRRARNAEGVADLLRTDRPAHRSTRSPSASTTPASVDEWLDELAGPAGSSRCGIAGAAMVAAVEDVGRLRDALGVPVPPGVPAAFTDPLDRPARRPGVAVRPHATGRSSPLDVADRLGLGVAVAHDVLRRLAHAGRVTEGEFRPGCPRAPSGATPRCCDGSGDGRSPRREPRWSPSSRTTLARFLPVWQNVGSRLRGVDGVLTVVEQLAGLPGAGLGARAVRAVQPTARLPARRCSTS